MIRLCNFIEYGCNNGVSIKDSACQQSYPEKQKIVSYLKNEVLSSTREAITNPVFSKVPVFNEKSAAII